MRFAILALTFLAEACTTHGGAPLPLTTTHWHLEKIGGADVLGGSKASLVISPEGRISGNGGCNAMFGHATIAGNTIAFGGIGSTMMACNPVEINTQERRYFDTLKQVASWSVHGDTLALADKSGSEVLTFDAE